MRPDRAERINATGACSNFVSIWKPERHDAANAKIAYTITIIRPTPLVRPTGSAMPDHLQSVNHDQYGGPDSGHDQIGPSCFVGYSPKERNGWQHQCSKDIAPEFPAGTIKWHRRDQRINGIDC